MIVASVYNFFHVMIKLLGKEDLFPWFIKMIGSFKAEFGGLEMWPRDPIKIIAKSHAKYL